MFSSTVCTRFVPVPWRFEISGVWKLVELTPSKKMKADRFFFQRFFPTQSKGHQKGSRYINILYTYYINIIPYNIDKHIYIYIFCNTYNLYVRYTWYTLLCIIKKNIVQKPWRSKYDVRLSSSRVFSPDIDLIKNDMKPFIVVVLHG